MTAPQCGTTRPPWEGGGGDTPDQTSRAKVKHTLVIPLADYRLKSLAEYQTTSHSRESYWSEDKVIT